MNNIKTMKSIYFNEKGDPLTVLKHGLTKIPDLNKNEIRVRLLASPINPADFLFIEKKYRIEPEFPQIAGFEGTGIIIDNNSDKNFPLNSLVSFRHKNIWAEYINIPKSEIIVLPGSFPVEKAAQLALNPLTAWALLDEINASSNQTIILSAGNSTISKIIVQFAKKRGVKTVPIVRNGTEIDNLINLGATAVLNSIDLNFEEQLKELSQKETIVGFLDAVGGNLASIIIRWISANSKIIHYGLYSDQYVQYHSSDLIFKNVTLLGFGIDKWKEKKEKSEMDEIWKKIIQEIIKSDFHMPISSKYSFDNYKKAINQSRSSIEGKTLFWIE